MSMQLNGSINTPQNLIPGPQTTQNIGINPIQQPGPQCTQDKVQPDPNINMYQGHPEQSPGMYNFLYTQYSPYMSIMEQEIPPNYNYYMGYAPNNFPKDEQNLQLQNIQNFQNLQNNQNNLNQKEEKSVQQNPKFKENYIELLVDVIDVQMKNGKITKEYLDSPTESTKIDNEKQGDENLMFKKNERKKCENKACSFFAENPSQLSKAKFVSNSSFKPKIMYVCDKCFQAYNAGNYCYYCNGIYMEPEHNSLYSDCKKWIQCDHCQKWTHIQCEKRKGKYPNIEELNNSNYKYFCPFCRKEQSNLARQSNKAKKGIKGVMLGKKKKKI